MTTKTPANNPLPNFYRASAADFKKIPGNPIAYWVSDKLRKSFENLPLLEEVVEAKVGLQTGDNFYFLKLWWEVNYKNIHFNAKNRNEAIHSRCRWFPHDKGGEYRKWGGNDEYVVNWENDGQELVDFKPNSVIRNPEYYFKKGITWSRISSNNFGVRYSDFGRIFDCNGPKIFTRNENIPFILCFLLSKITPNLLSIINPTLTFQVGDVVKLPFNELIKNNLIIRATFEKAVNVAIKDWDSYETSWDFESLPLLSSEYKSPTIKESYTKLRSHWQEMTDEMQRLEEENNRIFIQAYGLEDELTPDVPLSEITLTCNPHYRYGGNRTKEELEALLLKDTMKELISYAVGCMFGRYSLDKPGLILANQGETIKNYLKQIPNPTFMPDEDNIIPILDDEYFSDDIVSRFKDFLKITFGKETLATNLEFIAKALTGRSTGSPEKVIRDYFIKQFYKDHVQTYKKRPIYWMFSSGKDQGFNALIYMHRYDKSTLAKMRTDYLLELESKLIAEVEMLSQDTTQNKARLTKIKNQIEEMKKYDEFLNNKALSLIEIDLDDGVKVNYAKFEGLVKGI